MKREPLKHLVFWRQKETAAQNSSPSAEMETQDQQRHARFSKLTSPARTVLIASDEEARRLGTTWVGTEHLLLALTRRDSGIVSVVLHSLGVSRSALLTMLCSSGTSKATEMHTASLTLTPQARRAMELAVQEAAVRAMRYIVPEHIFFGVMRVLTAHPTEPANDALRRLNVSLGEMDRRVQMAFDHSRRFGRPLVPPS